MSIDEATVRRIAQLARIRVTDEEIAKLAPQLDGIVRFVEQLGEVDTENTEPLRSVLDLESHLRADTVNDGGIQDAVLANAPGTQEGYFVVPKVVEQDS